MTIFTPYGMPEATDEYLQPTAFFDFDHDIVGKFVAEVTGDETDDVAKAIRLFYATRDRIRYDIFAIRMEPAAFRASRVLQDGYAFCIPKAVLLVAAARAAGIPAAIGLSDVINHFTSDKVTRAMGGKTVFLHHGYAALYLRGEWFKVAPAFNIELCRRFAVAPTEFDGTGHAILQEYDADRNLRMEYLKDHGYWSDLPFGRIRDDFADYYPAAFLGGKDAGSTAGV